jgi:hypothetical protein
MVSKEKDDGNANKSPDALKTVGDKCHLILMPQDLFPPRNWPLRKLVIKRPLIQMPQDLFPPPNCLDRLRIFELI